MIYYPYLRGKQFELLAIQELLEHDRLNEFVHPIIEPVKNTSTLKNTINLFDEYNHPLYMIGNPAVGDLSNKKVWNHLNKYPAAINDNLSGYDREEIAKDLKMEIFCERDSWQNDFYPNNKGDQLKVIENSKLPAIRNFKKFNTNRLVALTDHFRKEDKNADYSTEPQFFSTDYLDYKEDFVGFSDYSIIGREYNTSGFAPRAVAIHIIYLVNNELWVRHFVSDTNGDISNVAGKFGEALDKLVNWYNDLDENVKERNSTIGLKEFIDIHQKGSYPGLGYVKKLSLMHHLEVVGRVLSDLDS